jgi:hypothetical protein
MLTFVKVERVGCRSDFILERNADLFAWGQKSTTLSTFISLPATRHSFLHKVCQRSEEAIRLEKGRLDQAATFITFARMEMFVPLPQAQEGWDEIALRQEQRSFS